MKREVELVQGFLVGQGRGAQRILKSASFADAEFFLQQEVNKIQIAHLVGLGAPDELGDGLGKMAQAQRCRGGFDAVGGQLVHRFSLAASA